MIATIHRICSKDGVMMTGEAYDGDAQVVSAITTACVIAVKTQ
jgi:hypothetical protein